MTVLIPGQIPPHDTMAARAPGPKYTDSRGPARMNAIEIETMTQWFYTSMVHGVHPKALMIYWCVEKVSS